MNSLSLLFSWIRFDASNANESLLSLVLGLLLLVVGFALRSRRGRESKPQAPAASRPSLRASGSAFVIPQGR